MKQRQKDNRPLKAFLISSGGERAYAPRDNGKNRQSSLPDGIVPALRCPYKTGLSGV